ncbi:TonB-dependent receptor [Pseudoalteromonas fenneropenaei]|uniref:TonB-dependent receptor n=1 Tax=Pseudoalteromonas fenneropenaei TaxID=1737459 RepID=A0ABV7CJ93_9GAMM
MRNSVGSVLFSLIIVPVIAAEQDAALQPIEKIVTTANRVEAAHLDLIGNTTAINASTLSEINAEHLNQVLSFSAGTWLSRGNGQESLLAIRSPVLTGAGSCAEFLMLEDGLPLRANGFCNVNQLFDSHFESTQRIEVVKGANSARYGSNAIHGAVNIVSKSLDTERGWYLEAGSYGYKRLHTDLPFMQGSNAGLVSLTLSDDDGFQESSGYQQQKLSFAFEHEFAQWQLTHRAHFSNLAQQTAGYLQQGEAAYKDKSLLKINDFPDAYRDSWAFRYALFATQQTHDGVWQITPYLRANDMEFLMHFLPGTPIEKNEHQSLGVNVLRTLKLSDGLSLRAGIDSEWTTGALLQYQVSATESDSAFLRAVLPTGRHYDYDVNANTIAGYLNLDYQLSDDLSSFVALRFDTVQYDYQNNMLAGNSKEDGSACGLGGCRYSRPSDTQDRFSNWSFSAGLSYALNAQQRIFAKVDDAFRAPHTGELYRLQNGQTNSDIDSVNAKQVEVGHRFANGRWFSEIVLYQLNKYDGIYQNTERRYVNGFETSHRGVEWDLQVTLTESLNASFNATYAKHTFENDGTQSTAVTGNDLNTAPRLMMNSQLSWKVVDDVTMSLHAQRLSKYYLNNENTEQYAGHTLVNLRSSWRIDPQLTLRLNLLNLFDERYAERADYAFGNHRYFVGKPRTASIIVDYRF